MSRRFWFVVALLFVAFSPLAAQSPQARLAYEDRSGTTGHSLTVEGKSFGPYKDIYSVTPSFSGTAGLFLVTKREKTYIVAQGKESGPLATGYIPDQTYISDDGKVAAVVAIAGESEGELPPETQLWVNGKVYGPFQGVLQFEYAESGGGWIAAVQVGEESYDVLLNGKSQGPFPSVEKAWMFPDGKGWGYAVRNTEGSLSLVTQDKKYSEVPDGNFYQMSPRSAHWAYSLRLGDEQELIVVDGKEYRDYLNFSGLYLTETGRHWGFEAEKLIETGDYPVVVIDGKEFVGEGLNTASLGAQESFSWTLREGNKVTYQVLVLP